MTDIPKSPAIERRAGIPLFRVSGIRVRLDYSWFFIFALILFVLAGYFRERVPGLSEPAYWTAAAIGALLFFLSIVLHELAHSLVAQQRGIRIPAITLFLFGGVSEMQSEPEDPQTELAVAAAGPATSFVLALVFFALYAFTAPVVPPLVTAVLGYLAFINGALGVFNLVPGFPLDGGRVFRALVWWKTGSLERATRMASGAGVAFGLALVVLGALQLFLGDLGGLWLVLIGLFLRSMAKAGYRNMMLKEALGESVVREVMVGGVKTVAPDLTLREVAEDYVLRLGYRSFPVVEDDRVLGLISVRDVGSVPKEEWDATRVRDRMRPVDARMQVAPDEPLTEALRKLGTSETGRLLVMENGELLGMLTKDSLARFVEVRQLLKR